MILKREKKDKSSSISVKKCLVLDLDNTLWGGIVGEDGIEGIKIGFEAPGSSFLAFQQAILDLYNRGIILAINSRNNLNDAIEVIRSHPNMVLKEEHFAAMRINWEEKADNMREIAKEINIGLDSMVFLDDDSIQRSLMREMLPEVETPELPNNPDQYTQFLMELPYFQSSALTDEDKMRGNMYITERLRKKSEEKHSSKKSFLKSIELKVLCSKDDPSCVKRLAQLTEKTNQFNMNKKPMSEKEIRNYIASSAHTVFHVKARDKFGDYGIIGFALIKKYHLSWKIESFLISCRAIGRGIEESFLHFISESAREENVNDIEIIYKKTDKNQPAKNFLDKYFKNMRYDLKRPSIKPDYIWIN